MKKRDIGQEILEGVKAIKEGKGRRFKVELPSDVKQIREHLHLILRGEKGNRNIY